jgi:pilus assembly protein Flp/PilA
MLELLGRLLSPRRRSEEGASAVEYGLLVAAIAAVVVGIVFALGVVLKGSFQDTCDKLKTTTCAMGNSVTP